MMCFKDMTFCPFWRDCANAEGCDRKLTPQVYEAAERWWGGPEAPICEFVEKPDCHEARNAPEKN